MLITPPIPPISAKKKMPVVTAPGIPARPKFIRKERAPATEPPTTEAPHGQIIVAEATGQEHLGGIGAGVGFLLAAVAVFFAGRKLNAPKRGFHPATGQPVEYRNAHTFFFVPMQYWAFVLPLAGAGAIATAFPL